MGYSSWGHKELNTTERLPFFLPALQADYLLSEPQGSKEAHLRHTLGLVPDKVNIAIN